MRRVKYEVRSKKGKGQSVTGRRCRNETEVALQAQFEFPTGGRKRIACKVQDDLGDEGLWTAEIEVKWTGLGIAPMKELMP